MATPGPHLKSNQTESPRRLLAYGVSLTKGVREIKNKAVSDQVILSFTIGTTSFGDLHQALNAMTRADSVSPRVEAMVPEIASAAGRRASIFEWIYRSVMDLLW